MAETVDDLIEQARVQFAQATDAASLENAKARFLGKQGSLTELMKGLGKLDPEAKRTEGARINIIKQQIEALLNARRAALAQAEHGLEIATQPTHVYGFTQHMATPWQFTIHSNLFVRQASDDNHRHLGEQGVAV